MIFKHLYLNEILITSNNQEIKSYSIVKDESLFIDKWFYIQKEKIWFHFERDKKRLVLVNYKHGITYTLQKPKQPFKNYSMKNLNDLLECFS